MDVVDILSGLNNEEAKLLRDNLGITSLIDDLSNNTVRTQSLNVYSNMFLHLKGKGSNHYLKCVDTNTGEMQLSPLPFLFDLTLESLADDLTTQLESLSNLTILSNLKLKSNLESNAIITNLDDEGSFKWSYLSEAFLDSSKNTVPSSYALSNAYNQSFIDNKELSNLFNEIIIRKKGFLAAESNFSDIDNLDDALSNLKLSQELITSNVHTFDLIAEDVHITSNIDCLDAAFSNLVVDCNLQVSNIYTHGTIIETSNITTQSINTNNIVYP